MKMAELRLFNFGPYKGEQSIQFPTDAQQRVMVVFGDNMRGKTSLMNALRWVLYGRAIDRHASEIDLVKLVNYEAQREGNWKLWVALKFHADGDEYELRRLAEPLELVSVPRSKRDMQTQVMLSRNGSVLNAGQIEQHINQFIPEQISRFYLFDGELLQEYEALLLEGSGRGEKIKDAIEQVLGVPALVNGRNELRTALKQAQAVQARENQQIRALESHARQSLQLREEITAHEIDLAAHREKLAGHVARIEEIDAELADTEQVRTIQVRLESASAELGRLQTRERDLQQQRFATLRNAWKDLIQPRLHLRHEEIAREIARQQTTIQDTGAVRERIRTLSSLLKESTCPVCDSSIEGERRQKYGAQLGALEAELAAAEFDMGVVGRLSQELTNLSRLRGAGTGPQIRAIEQQMDRVSIDLTRVESEIETLRDHLRGHDVARIAQLQMQRDGLLKLRGKIEANIEEISKAVEEKTNKLRQISNLMSRNPEGRNRRSSREVEVYDCLEQIFARSIDLLRERLRLRVEEEATAVFRQLTTENTYQRLRINANYGLTIVDRLDRDVAIRSAGAEQIVAMSLLSALNRTANRPGPIVIDTPFGRLDMKHRRNILEFVPNMAEQVVFLVHEGEIERTSGLAPIAQHIGATYEIRRVTSAHSELARI